MAVHKNVIFRKFFLTLLLDNDLTCPKMYEWLINSDQAYFYVHGGHKIQNNRIWAEFQSNFIFWTPLNYQEKIVCFAFSSRYFYGPYFFEENFIWRVYLDMLQNKFMKSLCDFKNRDEYFFQKDGAQPHQKKEVQTWQKEEFGAKFLV